MTDDELRAAMLKSQLSPEVVELVLSNVKEDAKGGWSLTLESLNSSDVIAIRNEDFPWLTECSMQVGSAFSSGGSLFGWAPMTLASLVLFLFNFRQKQIRLSVYQGVVLRDLISAGTNGLTLEELTASTAIREPNGDDLTSSSMLRILEELAAAKKANGTEARIVKVGVDEHWRAEGV